MTHLGTQARGLPIERSRVNGYVVLGMLVYPSACLRA
jgi:hypothetical protein